MHARNEYTDTLRERYLHDASRPTESTVETSTKPNR
jgi:hypothetical protein